LVDIAEVLKAWRMASRRRGDVMSGGSSLEMFIVEPEERLEPEDFARWKAYKKAAVPWSMPERGNLRRMTNHQSPCNDGDNARRRGEAASGGNGEKRKRASPLYSSSGSIVARQSEPAIVGAAGMHWHTVVTVAA
jgi:hypothetical protein